MKLRIVLFLALACAAPVLAAPGAAELKALLTELQKSWLANDYVLGDKLVRGLLFSRDRLKLVFRDDAPADAVTAIVEWHAKVLTAPPQSMARLIYAGPDRPQISVHAATTEEIIAYAKGTPAYNEFPGGTRESAQKLFRPGVTWYEVEFTEPGKDLGTKFHLFCHDGKAWAMLGPVWRFLKSKPKK